MNRNRIILLCLAFALLLPACESGLILTPEPEPTQPKIIPSPMGMQTMVPIPTKTRQPFETTPEPTFTPAPTPTPAGGSELVAQADGSTLFVDYRGGYQLTFPPAWKVVRVNQDEFTAVLLNEAMNDRDVQRLMQGLQNNSPDVYRTFALDLRHDSNIDHYIPYIYLRLDASEKTTITDARTRAFTILKNTFSTMAVVESKNITTQAGYESGMITARVTGQSLVGASTKLFYKTVVFLPHNEQFLMISVTAPIDLEKDMIEQFNQLIESYSEISQ